MDRVILYDDENYPHEIPVANGFVSRVVSAVFNENHADARRVADILNYQEQLLLANRTILAWFESENAGPDYGSLDRKTHPDGEQIWQEWWDRQYRLCEQAEAQARAALALTNDTLVKVEDEARREA